MLIFNKLKKITLKNPAKNPVLIFEEIGSDTLKEHVLKDIPATVFDPNRSWLPFTLTIAFYFLSSLHLLFKKTQLRSKSSKTRAVLGKFYRIYLLAILKTIRPKVVLTYIDDNDYFQWLSRHYLRAKFFAIQNGNRTKGQLLGAKNNLTNFFCFGKYEHDTYGEFGHTVDQFYPVGSLRGDIFITKAKQPTRTKYAICLVSQWKDQFITTDKYPHFKVALTTLDQLLSRYVKENDLNLAILGRWPEGSMEETYFRQYYGPGATFIPRDDSSWSTYQGMYDSDIVISFFSTSAREAMGWGKKVIFCDFSGTDLYTYYKDGLWLFRAPSYEEFSKRLLHVRQMSEEEYRINNSGYAHYLMRHDPKCPAQDVIRKMVLEVLRNDQGKATSTNDADL